MDWYEQVAAKFCISYKHKLVDICIRRNNNDCYSIAYACLSNYKSSNGKSGEVTSNGVTESLLFRDDRIIINSNNTAQEMFRNEHLFYFNFAEMLDNVAF
jgi:hypothetical protein